MSIFHSEIKIFTTIFNLKGIFCQKMSTASPRKIRFKFLLKICLLSYWNLVLRDKKTDIYGQKVNEDQDFRE